MSNRTGGLGLRFFGAWEWHTCETPLPRLRSRQGQWLLALLVLRRSVPVERAWLAAALWPESDDAQSLYNLRRNLSDLRRALGAEAWRLHAPTPRSLSLDLSDVECDLIEFDTVIACGDATSLERAAALYRGPLLPGCLEEWATPERASREEAVLAALETLAARDAGGGDWSAAAVRRRRALEIDPLRESAARGLMEALAAGGEHAAATQVYRAFRLRLRDELNAEPDAQTVALFQRLRAAGRQAASQTVSETARQMPSFDLGAFPEADPAPTTGRLPMPLMPLIGREAEIAAVTACLDRSRLVTLTGIGGIGKTRLAVAVAERVGENLGGAWFVDLVPLADPELISQTVLAALGVLERPDCSPWEALVEFLRSRRLLLVLDNCEHLAAACGRLARTLLQECPALRLLATSRETLRVMGEAVWPVPPLSLPATDAVTDTSEAARLFTARAAQADPVFASTAQSRREIALICRRLDGIPLAIEMAAARMRAMTPAQLCARLDDRFRLLTATGSEELPRRRTLRATLDWSYSLLDAEERDLLARVSAFVGGWTLEAAEAICTDAPRVPDLLLRLVDKSLVVFDSGAAGGRYHLLETVRQYAQERLREVGAWESAHRAQRDYFLSYAERAHAGLAGPSEAQWLRRLAADHDNLRVALTWSLAHDEPDTALRLACALTRFWRVRGHLSEGRTFLAAVLDAASSDPPGEAWREALREEGHLMLAQGRCREALTLFDRALAAARSVGDRRDEATALGGLGAARSNAGEYTEARGLLERALALNRVLGNRQEEATNLSGLGYLARATGDHAAAEVYLVEAITISRERGDALAEGESLGSLARVFLQRGDRQGARRLLGRTLTLYRRLGNRLGEAWTLNSLGEVAAEGGHTAKAAMLMRQALAINRAVGNRAGEAWNLRVLGRLQARTGHHAVARMTLQQALAIDRDLGNRAGEAQTLQALAEAAPPRPA